MLHVGEQDVPTSDDHEGFVAGRYRNGAYSDVWTDVRRCAERTFLAYAPVCECGWRGGDRPPTAEGFRAAVRSWFEEHHRLLTASQRSWQATEFPAPGVSAAPSAPTRAG